MVVHHLVDVRSRLQVFGLDGRVDGEIALPGVGSIADIYGRRDLFEVWFVFSSPLLPATVYRYDLETRGRVAFDPPSPPINPAQFETHAMFATSQGRNARAVFPDRARRG